MLDKLRKRSSRDVALAAAAPLGFVVASRLYGNQTVLLLIMIYAVLAQGINVVQGFAGYLPFGYFGIVGMGAYGADLSVKYTHVPAVVALVLGGLAGLLFGSLLMPLLKLSGAYFAIATLAAGLALYQLVNQPSLAKVTGGPYGVNDLGAVHAPGGPFKAALVLLGASCLVVAYLRSSKWGLSLRAMREDPVSAEMAGIDTVAARRSAWLVSSAIAGLAGAVWAWHAGVFYPDAAFDSTFALWSIVFMLFGGAGSLLGPVVGTAILYALYTKLGISTPQYFQIVFGALIMILVMFAPGGLAGMAKSIAARFRPRKPEVLHEVLEVSTARRGAEECALSQSCM